MASKEFWLPFKYFEGFWTQILQMGQPRIFLQINYRFQEKKLLYYYVNQIWKKTKDKFLNIKDPAQELFTSLTLKRRPYMHFKSIKTSNNKRKNCISIWIQIWQKRIINFFYSILQSFFPPYHITNWIKVFCWT